ncbi:MAG TPA: hypothetical protein VKB79_20505 [Bryobacteraceae bacterium]|nr:hypothetical protein [Bryobacteraceae bacterium]
MKPLRTHAITLLFAAALPLTSSLCAQSPTAQPEANPVSEGAAAAPDSTVQPVNVAKPDFVQDKHAFGVLPNYRTAEGDQPYAPITTKQKFKIATDDTIDGPSFLLAGVFAGLGQWQDSNPSFGQGVKGYFHRYLTGLADQDVGNYLTEAIVPTLLHQDPRYFRKGHGSAMSRIGWAVSRTVVARSDSGKWMFNASEFLGNGAAAALGNAYYPDSRGFGETMERMFTFIGTDAISQVLKEFWPDVKRKYFHKNDPALASDVK